MNLHNLKIDIDDNLKERVYNAGFGFSNNLLSDQELNYKSLFEGQIWDQNLSEYVDISSQIPMLQLDS